MTLGKLPQSRTDPKTYVPKLEDGLAFYHPDDVQDVQLLVERSMSKGEPYRFTKRLIRLDNKTITVEAVGLPIENVLGEVTRVVGVFRRIDE